MLSTTNFETNDNDRRKRRRTKLVPRAAAGFVQQLKNVCWSKNKNEQTVQSQGCTNSEMLNNATKEMLRRFF